MAARITVSHESLPIDYTTQGSALPRVNADQMMAIGEERIPGWILLVARLIVGGIFLLAAIDKVQAPAAFADGVRAYHLLPAGLVTPFAYIVPWLELLVAAYLILGALTRVGAAAAIVLLAMFVFALADSLLTGNTNHACGCFGAGKANPVLAFLEGGNTITLWDVIRDLILMALSALILVAGPGPLSVDAYLARRRDEENAAFT